MKLIYVEFPPAQLEREPIMDSNEKDNVGTDGEHLRMSTSGTIVGESVERNLQIDPKEEKKLLFKLDLHIAPIVMLLYLIAFLDR